MKDLCWDEYVIHGTPLLAISTADLLPPAAAPEYTEQRDLAVGVNLPLC